MIAALSSRSASSVRAGTGCRRAARSSASWSSSSRSLGRAGARRVGLAARPPAPTRRRRPRTIRAASSVGTPTGAPVSSQLPSGRAHELAALGELAERGRHRRAARADELRETPVRHRHRHGDALAARRVPSARRGARRASSSRRSTPLSWEIACMSDKPLRALREAVDEHRVDLGEPRSAARRSDGRAPRAGPARARSSGRRRGRSCAGPCSLPRTHHVARARAARTTTLSASTSSRVDQPVEQEQADVLGSGVAQPLAVPGPEVERVACGRRAAASPPPAAVPTGAGRGRRSCSSSRMLPLAFTRALLSHPCPHQP